MYTRSNQEERCSKTADRGGKNKSCGPQGGGGLPPAGPEAGTCTELPGRSGARDCDNQEAKKTNPIG